MIRRFLTRVLIAILIGTCCYYWWELRQATAQVARLQAELKASNRRTAQAELRAGNRRGAHAVAGVIPGDWVGQAEHHAALARAAAQRGDILTAQREVSLSAAAARKAVTEPALRTEAQIKHMQALLASAQSEASTLVRKAHQGLDGAQGTSHAP